MKIGDGAPANRGSHDAASDNGNKRKDSADHDRRAPAYRPIDERDSQDGGDESAGNSRPQPFSEQKRAREHTDTGAKITLARDSERAERLREPEVSRYEDPHRSASNARSGNSVWRLRAARIADPVLDVWLQKRTGS